MIINVRRICKLCGRTFRTTTSARPWPEVCSDCLAHEQETGK